MSQCWFSTYESRLFLWLLDWDRHVEGEGERQRREERCSLPAQPVTKPLTRRLTSYSFQTEQSYSSSLIHTMLYRTIVCILQTWVEFLFTSLCLPANLFDGRPRMWREQLTKGRIGCQWQQTAFVHQASHFSQGKNSTTAFFPPMYLLFFISPTQGNLHINKFRSPCSSFSIQFICRGWSRSVYVFVYLNLCLYSVSVPLWFTVAIIYSRISHAGSSQLKQTVFLGVLSKMFPCIQIPSLRRTRRWGLHPFPSMITFNSGFENDIPQVVRGLSKICSVYQEGNQKEEISGATQREGLNIRNQTDGEVISSTIFWVVGK